MRLMEGSCKVRTGSEGETSADHLAVLDRTKAQPLKAPDGTYNDPSAPGPTPEFDPDPHGNDSCTVRDVR